jgi:hypothetical protein
MMSTGDEEAHGLAPEDDPRRDGMQKLRRWLAVLQVVPNEREPLHDDARGAGSRIHVPPERYPCRTKQFVNTILCHHVDLSIISLGIDSPDGDVLAEATFGVVRM